MHFSIPDSKEVKGKDSSTYLVYNIHINGHFHCSLRYRQLLNLHEQLRKEFIGKIPTFPPKRILSLTNSQLEERRSNLEKYIQNASQNQEVASSDLFNSYFRFAQHETSGLPVCKKEISVFLQNGDKYRIDLWNNAPSSTLLKAFAAELKLKEEFNDYFGLFIFRKEVEGHWTVIRKLGEYESPLISLSWLTCDYRIIIRKCSWNLDEILYQDRVALNLIYIQTVSDIENGWISNIPKEILKELKNLSTQGNIKEYMKLARRLKFYGYMFFPNCQTDHPQPSIVNIHIGNKQLVYISPNEEIVFKITRIKCWRITLNHEASGRVKTEISLEYLIEKDTLQWITLVSEQAIIMAICLQEMVSDMCKKELPSNPSLIGVRSVKIIFYFLRRDGNHVPMNEESIIGNPFGNNNSSYTSGNSNGSTGSGTNTPSSISTASLPGILGNGSGSSSPSGSSNLSRHNSYDVNFSKRKSNDSSICRQSSSIINSSDNLFKENSAFSGIGDDDL